MTNPVILDCTLRDGGYYNKWDFPLDIIDSYLFAMSKVNVSVVEIGFRSRLNNEYKGPCAYSREDFLETLSIPDDLLISVMLNASELAGSSDQISLIEYLFPLNASKSKVDIVRIACNHNEVHSILPAIDHLSEMGFRVVINLMQIFGLTESTIRDVILLISSSKAETLYFADSRGCMNPSDTSNIVSIIKQAWHGPIGIHTHDNMGNALSNTLCAFSDGVFWLDSTVTGMGRGPGNARTEELVIEMSEHLSSTPDMIPLMNIISNYFSSLKAQYRWGTNPYYYLSGKYKIHPSFVQQMLSDVRFDDADILAVINSLKDRDASKFDQDTLKLERDMYNKAPFGSWSPSSILKHRDVLFIGPGNSVEAHLSALINYIKSHDVFVIAFNAISTLDSKYVDASIACHPVRLLADIDFHCRSDIPLITPYSMLSSSLQAQFSSKTIYDFGLSVNPESFEFHDTFCVCPSSLVLSYALAVCVSGGAVSLKLAGFDGYQPGDPRNDEVERILDQFRMVSPETSFFSITPTTYKNLPSLSIYAL